MLISGCELAIISMRANSDLLFFSSATWSASLCFTAFLVFFHIFSLTPSILVQMLILFALMLSAVNICLLSNRSHLGCRHLLDIIWHHHLGDNNHQVFPLTRHGIHRLSDHILSQRILSSCITQTEVDRSWYFLHVADCEPAI